VRYLTYWFSCGHPASFRVGSLFSTDSPAGFGFFQSGTPYGNVFFFRFKVHSLLCPSLTRSPLFSFFWVGVLLLRARPSFSSELPCFKITVDAGLDSFCDNGDSFRFFRNYNTLGFVVGPFTGWKVFFLLCHAVPLLSWSLKPNVFFEDRNLKDSFMKATFCRCSSAGKGLLSFVFSEPLMSFFFVLVLWHVFAPSPFGEVASLLPWRLLARLEDNDSSLEIGLLFSTP